MTFATADSLLDRAASLRLLDSAQMDAARALLASFADPNAYVGELARRGWLTPFQSERLLTGNGDELLLGSHVLLDKIGEGGMGSVFKARNWRLGRIVALKVIRPERQRDTSMRRFRREILASAQFDHPNIVRALDAEEHGDRLVLVMEYVEGVDLARLVREQGPLSVSQACDYVRQAAIALQHAHERGLVHRDIKPSNLFLTATGIKLLDFGLARSLSTTRFESGTMTETGMVLGTPDYLSPEQAREAHHADIRSDLYSLGCTLYFLLTARAPFAGGSLTAKLLRHQNEEPPALESWRNDVPAAVSTVVRQLMAKSPADRYQTPAELAAVLTHWTIPVALSVPDTVPSSPFSFAESRTESATPSRANPPNGRSRGRWAILGAGLVGLVALGLVLANRPERPEETERPDERKEEPLRPLEKQLRAFARRIKEGKEDATALRKELGRFRRQLPGEAGRLETAILLSQLRSPLDALDRDQIPEAERLTGQPKELVAVLGNHAGTNGDAVHRVAVSHDGRLVATVASDGRILLWDGETLRLREALRLDEFPTSIGFAPDVSRLAAVSRNGVARVWDVSTQPAKALHQFTAGSGETLVVLLGPDAKTLLIGGTEPGLRRWDLSGKEPRRLPDVDTEGRPIHSLAQSADGKRIAAGETGTLAIYDLGVIPPRRRHLIKVPSAGFNSLVALSLDGGTLAATNGTIWCWRLPDNGEPKAVVAGKPFFNEGAAAVALSPDGQFLVAGGFAGLFQVIGLSQDGAPVRAEGVTKTYTRRMAVSPDGRALYVGDWAASRLHRWRGLGGKEPTPDPASFGPGSPVAGLTFHQDDHLLYGSIFGFQFAWRLDRPSPVPDGNIHHTRGWAYAPDGSCYAYFDEDRLLIVPAENRSQSRHSEHFKGLTNYSVFSPDSRWIAAGSQGGTLMAFYADNQPFPLRFRAELGAPVCAICCSPDGKRVAALTGQLNGDVFDGATVHLREVGDGAEVTRLNVPSVVYYSTVTFTPDGRRIAVLSRDAGLLLWDPKEKEGYPLLKKEEVASTKDYAFSPDGVWLAVHDATPRIRLWKGKEAVPDLPLPEGTYPTRLTFAGDSRHLAVGLNIGAIYVLRLAGKLD